MNLFSDQTGELPLRTRLWILFRIPPLLLRAWYIKERMQSLQIALPAPGPDAEISEECTDEVARWVTGILESLPLKTGHFCFYRSFVLVYIIRHLGAPAVLNIGLSGFGPMSKTRGHCWLTVGRRLVVEKVDTGNLYPFEIGYNKTGIRYWAGVAGDGGEGRREARSVEQAGLIDKGNGVDERRT